MSHDVSHSRPPTLPKQRRAAIDRRREAAWALVHPSNSTRPMPSSACSTLVGVPETRASINLGPPCSWTGANSHPPLSTGKANAQDPSTLAVVQPESDSGWDSNIEE